MLTVVPFSQDPGVTDGFHPALLVHLPDLHETSHRPYSLPVLFVSGVGGAYRLATMPRAFYVTLRGAITCVGGLQIALSIYLADEWQNRQVQFDFLVLFGSSGLPLSVII